MSIKSIILGLPTEQLATNAKRHGGYAEKQMWIKGSKINMPQILSCRALLFPIHS